MSDDEETRIVPIDEHGVVRVVEYDPDRSPEVVVMVGATGVPVWTRGPGNTVVPAGCGFLVAGPADADLADQRCGLVAVELTNPGGSRCETHRVAKPPIVNPIVSIKPG